MNDQPDIDWSLTTWEGSRRAQLRRALAMTLRERMEAMEGLADVSRQISKMHAQPGSNEAGAECSSKGSHDHPLV